MTLIKLYINKLIRTRIANILYETSMVQCHSKYHEWHARMLKNFFLAGCRKSLLMGKYKGSIQEVNSHSVTCTFSRASPLSRVLPLCHPLSPHFFPFYIAQYIEMQTWFPLICTFTFTPEVCVWNCMIPLMRFSALFPTIFSHFDLA